MVVGCGKWLYSGREWNDGESIVDTPLVVTDGIKIYPTSSLSSYNPANGNLTLSWSAENSVSYDVTTIVLNEEPRFWLYRGCDRPDKQCYPCDKKCDQVTDTSLLPITADDMAKGGYLKVAIGQLVWMALRNGMLLGLNLVIQFLRMGRF